MLIKQYLSTPTRCSICCQVMFALEDFSKWQQYDSKLKTMKHQIAKLDCQFYPKATSGKVTNITNHCTYDINHKRSTEEILLDKILLAEHE